MTTTENPRPRPLTTAELAVAAGEIKDMSIETLNNFLGDASDPQVAPLILDELHSRALAMQPVKAAATPLPARKLRKGDVISMGTIDTATIPEGKDYVSIRFVSKMGEHGTAFPLDLEVLVFSRAGQQPMTLADVVTALTELTEQWEQAAKHQDKIRDRALEDGNDLIVERANAGSLWLTGCKAEVRAILARLQPTQPDNAASEQPECGEYGPNNGVCGQPVIDGICPDHGEVGPPVERS